MADGVRIPSKKPGVTNAVLDDFWDNMVDAIMDVPIRILIGIIGIVPIVGQPIANALGEWLLDTNEKAVAANDGVETISKGVHDGWFGGGGVGDPLEVQYTIEAIKDAIINGYNVEAKVQSGTWTKPENLTELVVICIGCGQNGENGQGTTRVSNGGLSGGFIAQQVDPETVASSTTYVVGLNQSPSSFGSHVTSAPGGGGISTTFGYTPTTSLPGAGGTGGVGAEQSGVQHNGTAGHSSALASGGAPGVQTGSNGTPGGAGGNVNAGSTTKCGGGGGGGGGGAAAGTPVNGYDGGAGGPGGYPGGGGGGGGGRSTSPILNGSNGAGGIGATGIIWIFWR